MAPVFSLMEKEVVRKMCELIGWSCGNGIFSPGGSLSNMYGLMCARYHRFPETKKKGCRHLSQLIIFASSEVHYVTIINIRMRCYFSLVTQSSTLIIIRCFI